MSQHVPSNAQLAEEQMEELMNTPVVSTNHPIGKDRSNDIGNNEIHISINC